MATLGDHQVSTKVQATVYGPAKIGKTFGAGTFPRPNVIDFDNGIATLTSPDFIAAHGWKPTLQYEQFTEAKINPRGVVTVASAFDQASVYFDKCMQPGVRDTFDTWIIDTGTFLAEAAMNKALMLLSGKHGFKGITSNTLAMGEQYGLVVPKLQDYGSERSMTEQFVDMVKSAGKHMLFICHEKEIRDDTGATLRTVPLLTGQSVDRINAMFDDVWKVEQRKAVVDGKAVMQRVIRTKSDKPMDAGGFMAGSRLGVPDGTAWNWDAISAALDANRAVRAAYTNNNPQQEK